MKCERVSWSFVERKDVKFVCYVLKKLKCIERFGICIMGVVGVFLELGGREWYYGILFIFIIFWKCIYLVRYFNWVFRVGIWGWFRWFVVLLEYGVIW